MPGSTIVTAIHPIVCIGLSKTYKSGPAFKDLSFAVSIGRTLALIGPNGAGKSSLIKCLLGLTKCSTGSAHLFGKPVDDPAARAGLGYLPERFAPPAYVTGREYLRYIVQAYGERFDEDLARHKLEQLNFPLNAMPRLTGTYSKGMNQKLGLCSLLLSKCRLLILDEPMSGLDPEARYLLRQQIQSSVALGVTALISTHALEDIVYLDAQVLALHQGRQTYFGDYQQLLRQTGTPHIEDAYLAVCSLLPRQAAAAEHPARREVDYVS
ncbi:MAG: ABC transporter ATP-binding protein [Burkholderiaceae bacterium]|jgi:ABC-2 type transport system ATP-binding protein